MNSLQVQAWRLKFNRFIITNFVFGLLYFAMTWAYVNFSSAEPVTLSSALRLSEAFLKAAPGVMVGLLYVFVLVLFVKRSAVGAPRTPVDTLCFGSVIAFVIGIGFATVVKSFF